jgi:hypothetical protein
MKLLLQKVLQRYIRGIEAEFWEGPFPSSRRRSAVQGLGQNHAIIVVTGREVGVTGIFRIFDDIGVRDLLPLLRCSRRHRRGRSRLVRGFDEISPRVFAFLGLRRITRATLITYAVIVHHSFDPDQ